MTDLNRIIRAAVRAGLLYQPGRKHARLVHPGTGRAISVSSTPSCRNAHKNVARDLRRYLGVAL